MAPLRVGRWLLAAAALAVAVALTWPASAQEIDLQRPDDREFVRDLAEMIEPEDEQRIAELADQLLTDKVTPIIVVTIESMAAHGGAGMRIETFAHLLFDQWQIGHAEVNEQKWNTGILLLVSRDDRKARIQLGAGWGREKDELCAQIMGEQIIPRFKAGDFSAGIVAGVEALDAMAREKQLPAAPISWKKVLLIAAFVGLAIFTVVSLIRRGSSGWAWLLWGVVFSVLGFLLYQMLTSRGGGGGGFSGGSFGGGFSGGGGATGSW
jgi:uncharacterized protein